MDKHKMEEASERIADIMNSLWGSRVIAGLLVIVLGWAIIGGLLK